MTTRTALGDASRPRFVLPDIPEKHPDDMTSAQHLSETGLHHHLKQFLGRPETTIVSGERYMILQPGAPMRYPDLMVAFDADPQAYLDSNGYIISDQGKPPDFVLEIASKYSGKIDVTAKRDFYESLAIPEYWRFDATGEFHGVKLAGDRLVGSRFEPILVAEPSHSDAETWQGFSEVLGLFLRWRDEELGFIDPATGDHIATFESLRLRAERAEREAAQDRQQLALDRQQLALAETRVQELEAELRRRSND